MKILLYKLCQCTYGIFQTFLGFCVFAICCGKKHYGFHGAVVTEWKLGGSVSLGMFLFVSDKYKEKAETAELYKGLVAHEYGHSLQSLILGPLYLLIIGIPSFMWAALPVFRKMRRERRISYYSFYTESWANALGERINTNKKPNKSIF